MDTLWTAAQSPYLVTDPEVVVTAGVTLTLEPGTVVRFGPAASLRLEDAALRALGTAENPIQLLPAQAGVTWGPLVARGGQSSLTLRHVEVSHGHLEALTGAAVSLQDGYLHDYTDGPIVHTLRPSSFVMRHCHLARYYEVLNQFALSAIEDSLFEDIHGDGIDFDAALPGSVIRRCTLRRGQLTNVDGIDLGSYGDGTASRGVTVEGCVVYDFPFDKGVSIGERAQDITVRDTVVYRCDSGIAVKDSSRAELRHNTISETVHGVHLYQKTAGQGGGEVVASANVLWGNTNSITSDAFSTATVTDSDVEGVDPFPGAGNRNLDPRFRNAIAHDFRLRSDSPLVGAALDGTDLGARPPFGSSRVDTDSDGLPDPWEQVYDLDFLDPADATLDPDQDRLDNLAEYLSGTDPRNPLSVLSLRAIAPEPGAITLGFHAVSEHAYTLQYRALLEPANWLTLTHYAPDSLDREVQITVAVPDTSGPRLYRLRLP